MSLAPVTDQTRRSQIVESLRRMVVTGDVTPGQRLTETQLADELGVSRAVLREAVRELISEGLLVAQPYRGLYVRSFERRDLIELYSLRTTLETMAFTHAWPRRSPEALRDLERRHQALSRAIAEPTDSLCVIQRELELHDWCYDLADHRMLRDVWTRIKPSIQFYFALHQQAHGRLGPRMDAHETYVSLASGDDLTAMIAHLDHHMRQGLERTLAMLPTATRD